jgi:hypothetical protein
MTIKVFSNLEKDKDRQEWMFVIKFLVFHQGEDLYI